MVNALHKAGVELGEHGGVVNPVLPPWRLIDRGSKLWLSRVVSIGLCTVWLAYRKKPRRWIPGLPPLFRRDGGGRETITTAQLSHLTEINQPTLNEKRALTAGGQGSYRSPERESIG